MTQFSTQQALRLSLRARVQHAWNPRQPRQRLDLRRHVTCTDDGSLGPATPLGGFPMTPPKEKPFVSECAGDQHTGNDPR
jgi:hypothetical protein